MTKVFYLIQIIWRRNFGSKPIKTQFNPTLNRNKRDSDSCLLSVNYLHASYISFFILLYLMSRYPYFDVFNRTLTVLAKVQQTKNKANDNGLANL